MVKTHHSAALLLALFACTPSAIATPWGPGGGQSQQQGGQAQGAPAAQPQAAQWSAAAAKPAASAAPAWGPPAAAAPAWSAPAAAQGWTEAAKPSAAAPAAAPYGPPAGFSAGGKPSEAVPAWSAPESKPAAAPFSAAPDSKPTEAPASFPPASKPAEPPAPATSSASSAAPAPAPVSSSAAPPPAPTSTTPAPAPVPSSPAASSAAPSPSSEAAKPSLMSAPASAAPSVPASISKAPESFAAPSFSSEPISLHQEGGMTWSTEGPSTTNPPTMIPATSVTPTSAIPSATTFPPGLSLAQCGAMADGILPSWAGADFNFSGKVRTYYMTSEQISWNYAPTGWDNWLGVPMDYSPRAAANGYLASSGSIGGANGFEWQKAVYRGYTNISFTEQTAREPWLGINGPVMRAEMGDLIQVVFLNKLKNNYASVHSMGLGYDKSNDGADYPDTLAPNTPASTDAGSAVPPGGCFTYKWVVGALNLPADGFNSRLWSYHPFVNMPLDLVTGLVGPVIVYRRGTMTQTMAENREFVLLYEGFPENLSWLSEENAAMYAPSLLPSLSSVAATWALPTPTNTANASVYGPQLANFPTVRLTEAQAPTFQTLNGFVYGNMPRFEMCQADATLWYVYAYGAQSHTFHLHGNNFQVAGLQTGFFDAAVSINNGEMLTLSMNASRPGLWQALCHVSSHMFSGMVEYYEIFEQSSCPLPKLTKATNSTIP